MRDNCTETTEDNDQITNGTLTWHNVNDPNGHGDCFTELIHTQPNEIK